MEYLPRPAFCTRVAGADVRPRGISLQHHEQRREKRPGPRSGLHPPWGGRGAGNLAGL